jgi:outer membrane scaffolding protein for murein synthesis (MipA/OmpV family)
MLLKKVLGRLCCVSLALTCGAAVNNRADAEELPRWELGVGLGALSLPDYRGSDESSHRAVPLPYFVYRLEWLTADREGLRADFFKSDAFEVTLSFSGFAPFFSDDNTAREGMPDLNYMLELGPSLDVRLWRSAGGDHRVGLVLPVRAAIELDGGLRYQGWTFTPRLAWSYQPSNYSDWKLIVQAGLLYGSQRYNHYFYSVDDQYATASRPAYQATSGYAGAMAQVALSRRFGDFRIIGFLRGDNLDGATFEDSPLVKTRNNLTAGFFLTWTFMESEDRVQSGRLL